MTYNEKIKQIQYRWNANNPENIHYNEERMLRHSIIEIKK